MDWIRGLADFWGSLGTKVDFFGLGIGRYLLAIIVCWILASLMYGFSYIRHRWFNAPPPDDFEYYFVPALGILCVFGGLVAIGLFAR